VLLFFHTIIHIWPYSDAEPPVTYVATLAVGVELTRKFTGISLKLPRQIRTDALGCTTTRPPAHRFPHHAHNPGNGQAPRRHNTTTVLDTSSIDNNSHITHMRVNSLSSKGSLSDYPLLRTPQDSVQSDNDALIVKSQDDPVNAWKPSMGMVQEPLTSSPVEEVFGARARAGSAGGKLMSMHINTSFAQRSRTPTRSCLRPRSYLHRRVLLLRSRLPLPITPTTTPLQRTPRCNRSLAQPRLNCLICPRAITPLVNIGGHNQRLCFRFRSLPLFLLPLQRLLIPPLHLSLPHTHIAVYHVRRAIVRSTTRYLCSKMRTLRSIQWLKLPHSVHSPL